MVLSQATARPHVTTFIHHSEIKLYFLSPNSHNVFCITYNWSQMLHKL